GEYEQVARRTVAFVLDELRVALGFASSLDADADAREGSHITWTVDEVTHALRDAGLEDSAGAVLSYLSIAAPGDLDGRSVPHLSATADFTAPAALRAALRVLLDVRRSRPQPRRDDKVVLEWNAMFARALFSSRDATMVASATQLLESLATSHRQRGHWWRTESAREHATAADLAWMIDAHVDAFEDGGDDRWLTAAYDIAGYLIEHFWDGAVPTVRAPHEGGGFFSTSDQCTDLFVRPKEVFDGATPSSHAVATRSLARLALCRGDQDLLSVAERLVQLGAELITTHPRAVVDLVDAAGYVTGVEVVIPGGPNPLRDHVRSLPMLRGVLITGAGTSPLLADRQEGLAYVCHAGSCERPVANVAELDQLLRGSY
ncbi:MAG: thioredoxin domain-containing protein, partial [Acidobacteria bacterium]|nr:thioredoxin domain-containing protein [Acidobacteriota bacterium]